MRRISVLPALVVSLLGIASATAASAQLDILPAGLTIAPLLDPDAQGGHGPAVILEVWDGTPAATAGLERGDVIVSINGTKLSGKSLRDAAHPAIEAPPGSDILLSLLRPSQGMRSLEVKFRAMAVIPPRKNPSFEPFGYESPRTWRVEDYSFPLTWASDIDYQGVEDVLFAPGFADHAAPGYHALVWFWWLDGAPRIDAASLRSTLLQYFRGLTQERASSRGFTADLAQVRVTVDAEASAPQKGQPSDPHYAGQVITYNPEGQLITLYVEADTPACPGSHHTAIRFRLATQPPSQAIWNDLRTEADTFRCRRTAS